MEEEHKKLNTLVVSGLVLVVIGAVWLLSSDGDKKITRPDGEKSVLKLVQSGDTESITKNKQTVLARIGNGRPLNDAEKTEIFELLRGDRFATYGFTLDEQQTIIKALNSK